LQLRVDFFDYAISTLALVLLHNVLIRLTCSL
jgi:hypothetical protein